MTFARKSSCSLRISMARRWRRRAKAAIRSPSRPIFPRSGYGASSRAKPNTMSSNANCAMWCCSRPIAC